MKTKIVVSFSIFTLLLSAAWFLHQQQNYRKISETNSSINSRNVVPMKNVNTPLNTNINNENSNNHWKVLIPFRPREYVRIIRY